MGLVRTPGVDVQRRVPSSRRLESASHLDARALTLILNLELTLTAQCVGSNKKIVMDRYSNYDSPYLIRRGDTGYQEVWRSGEIRPEWWHFV